MFIKIFSIACLIFLFAIQASAQSPQVPPEPEADRPAEVEQTGDEEQGNGENVPPPAPDLEAKPVKETSNAQGEKGSEQVTTIVMPGVEDELKITDILIAIFTGVLAVSTIGLWWASIRQSNIIKDSIALGEKNAKAFQGLIASQMRAYLFAIVGTAQYQGQQEGWRFKGIPLLINRGQTPAHKVGYRACSAILPNPLPKDFDFPFSNDFTGATVMGPHEQLIMGSYVEEPIADDEIEDIKIGKDKALYTWGEITYTDSLGEDRLTKFCHRYLWDGERVIGEHTTRHNSAN